MKHMKGLFLLAVSLTVMAFALGKRGASFDVSAIATSTTDEQQPDILGIKIGMSVAEVRPLLRARHLDQYAERKSQIAYTDSRLAQQSIPGEFVSLMSTYAQTASPVVEQIVVSMSPIPGAEQVARVSRYINVRSKESYFSLARLKESLISKNGQPSAYRPQSGQDEVIWRYNAPPTRLNDNDLFAECIVESEGDAQNIFRQWATESVAPYNYVLRVGGLYAQRPGFWQKLNNDCGGIYLLSDIIIVNQAVPADQQLVRGYTLTLSGNALAMEAKKRVDATIAADKQARDKANLERAKSRIPDD